VSKLWAEIRSEPAVIVGAVNTIVAALVAFGLHLTATQTGAVTTISTAVLAIIVAAATRPVAVPVITGAVATAATAAAAFGLHLSAAQIGTGVPVLALVLSLVLRQAITPISKLKAAPGG
jgi:hypothetical protein